MIEKFRFPLAAQFQSVRSTPELLAKGANEPTFLIEYNDGLAAHARLVNGVPNVDVPLLILAQSVGVSPHQPFRWDQPVVDALVSVRAGTKHGKAGAGLVRSLDVERRQRGRQSGRGTCCQERSASLFVHSGRQD